MEVLLGCSEHIMVSIHWSINLPEIGAVPVEYFFQLIFIKHVKQDVHSFPWRKNGNERESGFQSQFHVAYQCEKF